MTGSIPANVSSNQATIRGGSDVIRGRGYDVIGGVAGSDVTSGVELFASCWLSCLPPAGGVELFSSYWLRCFSPVGWLVG